MIKIFFLSFFLFLVGIVGFIFWRTHAIMLLILIEILILAVNINFIASSLYLDDLFGFVFSLLNLTSAASESAIGLGILIILYRLKGNIALDLIILLKA